jgi:hypothetical protein
VIDKILDFRPTSKLLRSSRPDASGLTINVDQATALLGG